MRYLWLYVSMIVDVIFILWSLWTAVSITGGLGWQIICLFMAVVWVLFFVNDYNRFKERRNHV